METFIVWYCYFYLSTILLLEITNGVYLVSIKGVLTATVFFDKKDTK